MSKLDELIKQLCPGGVQYKEFKEISRVLKKGTLKTDVLVKDGKYPVMNSGRSIYGRYNSYNNEGEAITVAARGEYAGFINYFDEKFWAGGLCYPYKSIDETKIKTKFIYYYLKLKQEYIRSKLVTEGSIPALNKTEIDKFNIPIPPLAIQEEIVNILDAFTTLEANLEAELEARKKQYTFYRDSLLSFEEKDVEWKTLGEVCNVYTGGEAPENSIKGENATDKYKYPIYGNGIEVYGFTDTYRIDKDAVTISSIGAKTGAIYYRDAYFTPIIRLKVVIPKNEDLISRYLFYFLSSITINSKKSSVPNMNADDVKKIKIPIPTLAEQHRIVKILDKFDALVNDISIGLPAEIEARKKQYEYYRNQLLTFNI